MSAVPSPSLFAVATVIEHPWVIAAGIDARPRSGAAGDTTVRIVPSVQGLDALRARGKASFVAALKPARHGLPSDPRAWRMVNDLHDPTEDDDDRSNKARVRSLLRPSADALEATLFVPYDLRVFEGHFENVPLVPGVIQVAWVLALAREHLLGAGKHYGIKAVKFRRLVRPGMELQLSMQWAPSSRELRFEYCHEGTSTATGRLVIAGGADD